MDSRQAYTAMFLFLESYWKETGSGDIAAMLGCLAMLEDGTPADPAMEVDWEEAVSKAVCGEVEAKWPTV